MSNRIFQAVWDNGPQSRSEMLVLMVLADSADAETGECFPSLRRIAQGARMSVRTAQLTLRALESEGWIVTSERLRSNGSRASSVYRVQIDKLGLAPIRKGAAKTAGGGAKTAPLPPQKLHPTGGAETAPLEQTINNKGPAALFVDLFSEWQNLPGVPGQTKLEWSAYKESRGDFGDTGKPKARRPEAGVMPDRHGHSGPLQ